MNATNDPGHNEYLAAIAGLPEQTVSPAHTESLDNLNPDGWVHKSADGVHVWARKPAPAEPAVGDFVSGCTAGKRWSGRVEWIKDGELCINPDGAWLYVPLSDITH